MSDNYIYITGTDYSVLSAQVASGYFFINPYNNSSNYYTNTASAMSFASNTWVQSFSGTTFTGTELLYKRTTTVNLLNTTYSEFSTINYVLSGIVDTDNPITKIIFEPIAGELQTVVYNNAIDYTVSTPYQLALGNNTLNNPKNSIYRYNYDLNDSDADVTPFTSRFSAYRHDGLVDEYVINLNIGRDSIYNISDEINLLEAQVLPLSTLDPVLKIELENPDYVNHIVLKRDITPTPTRTVTYTSTPNASPTRSATPTNTYTITQTPTRTKTTSLTLTPTYTSTPTQTKTRTPTQGVTASRTRTPTPSLTSRVYTSITPPPTPSPSLSSECRSKTYTITYTGRNDAVDASTVYVGLKYNYSETIKSLYAVALTTVTGTNTVDVNVPVPSSDSQLEAYVYFTADDPGITISNIVESNSCSLEPIDKFIPAPPEEPEPVPEPPTIPPTNPNDPNDPNDPTTPDLPKHESVFQFGIQKEFIPVPIVVDLPAEEGTTMYPALPEIYEQGAWQSTRVTINWTTFKSTRGLDILNNDLNSTGFPNNIQPLASGSRSYIADHRPDEDVKIGAPILSYDVVSSGGETTYIWFKVTIENIDNDYSYYFNTWLPAIALYPNKFGFEYRLQKLNDPTKDEDFTDLTYIPRCQFRDSTYTAIYKMVDIYKWYDQNQPITYTITNS